MRRRIIVTVILVIAALLLQTAVIPVIFPSFITPNLLLILVVSFGFMCGSRTGIWLGFVTGLLLDLLYGDFVGFNALLYMSLGYMNGRFCKVFFDEDLKVPMLLAGISDFIYGTLYFLFLFALKRNHSYGVYLRYTILPEVISTILFTILIYKLLFWINSRLSAHELEEQQSPWLGR
ncbi:MAG: rod shape-determining protein MreD [Lachnospiraceae bacterium]|jgi:rod shape-determining protein MreD|nr:rod shape-determining protein MreD [Lachnospiraceae bacterium]MCI1329190.1 rod shape-determining protein MreD [Lachnospiraceae bacterium]